MDIATPIARSRRSAVHIGRCRPSSFQNPISASSPRWSSLEGVALSSHLTCSHDLRVINRPTMLVQPFEPPRDLMHGLTGNESCSTVIEQLLHRLPAAAKPASDRLGTPPPLSGAVAEGAQQGNGRQRVATQGTGQGPTSAAAQRPRVGPSATYANDWPPGVHERQLQRLARRGERDGGTRLAKPPYGLPTRALAKIPLSGDSPAQRPVVRPPPRCAPD